jgi:hypothetical protein
MRIRRDAAALMTAIKASAVVHKAQRKLNAEGQIVATLADYEVAHFAIDTGLRLLYREAIPEVLLPVMRAAEGMGAKVCAGEADADASARISGRALRAALKLASLKTAQQRMREAVEHGLLKLFQPEGGYHETETRRYSLGMTVEEAGRRVKGGEGVSIFPQSRTSAPLGKERRPQSLRWRQSLRWGQNPRL